MFLNKSEEFVDIGDDLGTLDVSAFLGDGNSGNCGLEIAGGDVEPLVDKPPLEEISSVELVAGGSEVPDDGVGGEESSFAGFEEGKSVEGRKARKVGVGVVLDFLDFDLESVDDRFYFSVSAVGDGVVAEVELHVVEIN